MATSRNLPATKRPASNKSHFGHTDDSFVLLIQNEGNVQGFLDLLDVIYETHVKASYKLHDCSMLWVSFPRDDSRSLAGARVAARVCGVEFVEITDLH